MPTWVVTITSLGVGSTLVSFADDPTGFVLDLLRGEVVLAIFNAWSWFLSNVVVRSFDLVELAIIDGIAIPIRDAVVPAGSAIYGALLALQVFSQASLMELGIAAPFALAASWVVLALVVATTIQLVWAFAATYLPVDSVTEAYALLQESLTVRRGGGADE